jgi:hypothetical protein
MISILWWGWPKTIAGSNANARVLVGKWMVRAEQLDPNVLQDTIKNSLQRLSIGVIKTWLFLCEIIQFFLKVQNSAADISFWLCPD